MTHRSTIERRGADGLLVRALGIWALAASIVNITVGGGIFRLPASAAQALGAEAPVAYIVCAVATGLIVLCFAEAGSRVASTGGLYAYVDVAFGPFVGFLSGVLLWAGITVAMAAVASFFGDALGALVPSIATGVRRGATLSVILAGLALLNMAGVRGANRFNVVMTVAKLLPLLLLIVVGLFRLRPENLAWTEPVDVGKLSRASVVLLFAFLGVESALVPSGEVKDPARTVPRALLIAMLGITLLYLLVQIVAQGILGPSLAAQKTPLAEVAETIVPGGRMLILVGSVVSMFGFLSGMSLAVPRMLFAFGRGGFLPAQLASVHPRFKTPYVAIAIQAVIVIVLAVSGSFEKLVVIANGSILLMFGACCLAVIQLRRRGIQQSGPPFRVPFGGLIPVLAVLVIVWLLTSLKSDEWKALLVLVGVAVVVYVASLPSRRAALSAETLA